MALERHHVIKIDSKFFPTKIIKYLSDLKNEIWLIIFINHQNRYFTVSNSPILFVIQVRCTLLFEQKYWFWWLMNMINQILFLNHLNILWSLLEKILDQFWSRGGALAQFSLFNKGALWRHQVTKIYLFLPKFNSSYFFQ